MVACAAVAQTATDAGVPRLIKFSGTMSSASSSTVGVTFALYAEQTGGAPLWLETQNVTPDSNGRYTIYLGANHANGVPLDLFASGEARWLGVQPEGQPEQARILLTSVPYALTAGDAQTLGGQPLSAFVLASAANGTTTTSSGAAPTNTGGGIVALASPQATPSTVTTSGSALTNYLAKFTSATDVESSVIYDTGTAVGIGTTSPAAILHVATTTPPAAYFDIYSGSPTTALSTMPTVNRAARGTPPGTSPGPSAVQLNDYLAGMAARGYGTTGFATGGRAALRMQAAEAWTDQNQGTFMSFWTSAKQSTTSVEHMRIDPFGNVGIGTQTPTSPLEVNGNIKLTQGSGSGLMFSDSTTQRTWGVTSVGPGFLLSAGSLGQTLNTDTTYLQRRIGTPCAGGAAINGVNADGSANCQAFITGASCPSGTAINSIDAGGSPICQSVSGTLTPPIAITGSGTPAVLSVTASSANGTALALSAPEASTATLIDGGQSGFKVDGSGNLSTSGNVSLNGSGKGITFSDNSQQTSALRHGRASTAVDCTSQYYYLNVQVMWNQPFADTNYTVSCSLLSTDAAVNGDTISWFLGILATDSVTVHVQPDCDTISGPDAFTIHCIGIHD
jgi:hypothetical protein